MTAALLLGGLAGCDAASSAGTAIAKAVRSAAPSTPAEDPAANPDEVAAAIARLAAMPVKGRAPKTGYSRDQFGAAWADVDHNGCDTRNDILARDLTGETFKPGTHDCVVATGTLADKYTGTTIRFVRGADTSSAVQIDHIVPLSLAWQTGAQRISEDQRKQFANDPLNLMAADGPSNMAKSDKDAATWLPPNKAFRCEYAARMTAVKAKYNLWVTRPEHDAIEGILTSCALSRATCPGGCAAGHLPKPVCAAVPRATRTYEGLMSRAEKETESGRRGLDLIDLLDGAS